MVIVRLRRALLALLIIVGRINRTIVLPICQMADAAGDFVAQSHETADPSMLAYKSLPVRRNDEIGFLSDSITNMTGDMVEYMKNLTRVTADREQMGYSVDKVCQETNNQLSNSNESTGMKITAFMGIIDLETVGDSGSGGFAVYVCRGTYRGCRPVILQCFCSGISGVKLENVKVIVPPWLN